MKVLSALPGRFHPLPNVYFVFMHCIDTLVAIVCKKNFNHVVVELYNKNKLI